MINPRKRKKIKYTPRKKQQYVVGQSEKKYYDGSKGQTTVSSTGTILSDTVVAQVVQGTGESERIGRTLYVTKLMLRGRVILPTTSTDGDTSDSYRIIIYKDCQTNKAAATVANLLSGTSINDFRNLENSKRFQFLYDKTFAITAQAGAGNGTSNDYGEVQKYFQIYLGNLHIPIEYTATAGVVADLTQNNIGVMAISASGLVNIKYQWRLRYSDK